ncbi:MAG: twin-arginine translocase TatA/TatE family subunit [Nitrososphaeraceae archaeon]|nr:twin-arginine translocase TatA/TatE family subunit [Nitrososphaeraceae archaeon]
MAFGGPQWIIILLLGLFLLIDPKRLATLSKTLGKAVGEYQKAQELFRNEMENSAKMVEESKSYFTGPNITAPVNSEREKLEQIAGSLGIGSIDDKTNEQLRFLISKRLQE